MAENIKHIVTLMIEKGSVRCFVKFAFYGGIPTESHSSRLEV
jgi:hypothetical protein